MGGKKKVKEEFIGEKDNGDENKQIKPMGPKEKNNCVKVYDPSGSGRNSERGGLMLHNELEGEMIAETGYTKFLKKVHSLQEKAVSQNQQQLAGMALAYLRGEMPDASEEVKKMSKMGEKKLRDFAKTKHEGLPEKVKESKCDDSSNKEVNDKEDDPRSMGTKINLVKNKMRAMGLKMSYEPEGEMVENLAQMAANVTDALPWNRNTKYTTQGKLRKPGENVHGQQTGRGLNTSTSVMTKGGAKRIILP